MNILTTGLPYANGALHLGHIYEWFLADTLARLSHHTLTPSVWISGDDAHGVAVSNAARANHVSPQKWVDQLTQQRLDDLNNLNVLEVNYLSTATPFHRTFVQNAYKKLKTKGLIQEVSSQQYFSDVALFERDVVGQCPSCHTQQYLGVCENCQRSLEAGDLINPIDAASKKPVHLQNVKLDHFKWGLFRSVVEQWIDNTSHPDLKNKLLKDLKDLPDLWCIERVGEYFGVPVPGKSTHFYVWFDALLGYFSFAQELNLSLDHPLTHILGKDILTFHALRLPALCAALDLPLPNPLIVHGHVVGENRVKFSKSLNNAPNLSLLRETWGDDVLRYYLLRNTRGKTEDIPLIPTELDRCKSQLANTIGNTFRRLHKIGHHHPLIPLSNEWKNKLETWDNIIPQTLKTGNTAQWLERAEELLAELAQTIQNQKWWLPEKQEDAQQGYVVITQLIKRLQCVLPNHLTAAAELINNQAPAPSDTVFFKKGAL